MGYFLLSDGLLSVGREGVKSWTGDHYSSGYRGGNADVIQGPVGG